MWYHYINIVILSIIIIVSMHYVYDFLLKRFTIPKTKQLYVPPDNIPIQENDNEKMENELVDFISTL